MLSVIKMFMFTEPRIGVSSLGITRIVYMFRIKEDLALAFFLCESVKMVAVPVNSSKQTV